MQREPERLAGCGLVVVNPPWTLHEELQILLPPLAKAFAGAHRIEWLARGE
jgi:23S rRNA (adenine2030-N6)-methyltransferase